MRLQYNVSNSAFYALLVALHSHHCSPKAATEASCTDGEILDAGPMFQGALLCSAAETLVALSVQLPHLTCIATARCRIRIFARLLLKCKLPLTRAIRLDTLDHDNNLQLLFIY